VTSTLDAIGRTPVARLERLGEPGSAEIWVKLEGSNPIVASDAFAAEKLATMRAFGTELEGVFSGPSTGANLVAALGLARRLGAGKRVATVQVDSGLKYLAGGLYADGAP
jgi:cysteine synthase